MVTVTINLAPRLAAVLPGGPPARPRTRLRHLPAPTSVKDALEALGLPHVEIGAVTLDGIVAGLDDLVRDGSRLTADRVAPSPVDDPRFLCDLHLGKLARLLRVMGFDTAYEMSGGEPTVARRAVREGRILLSRGRAVLKRREIQRGMLVLPDRPDEQAAAVMARFLLADRVSPWSRCALCNGRVLPVAKKDVAHRIPPRTARWLDDYHACENCEQLYWEGTHVERLRARIATIIERARSRNADR